MSIQNFRHRLPQCIVIGIIVFLATLLLNGSASILLSLDEPIEKLKKECQAAEGILILNNTDAEEEEQILSDLGKQDNVRKIVPVNIYFVTEKVYAGQEKMTDYLRLAEYQKAAYEHVRVIAGSLDGSKYNDSQCAISASIANKHGLSVGDEITFEFARQSKTYEIAGIFANPYNVSAGFSQEVIVSKIPEYLNAGKAAYIYTQKNATIQDVEETYRLAHDGNINGVISSLDHFLDNQLLSTHIIGGIFLGIGIVILLVSVLVIYFIIKNMFLSDTKKIAIYKTIGYSHWDILNMYMKFFTVLILISTVLGIGFSQLLSAGTLKNIYQDIGQKMEYHFLYPGIFCLLGIVILTSGTIYGILSKTKNIKPVYAFHSMSNQNTKKRKHKGNMKLMFSTFGIALRNVTRDKKGAAGIWIACVATIYIINFAVISIDVANNMGNMNDYWFAIPPSDVMVNVNDDKQLEKTLFELQNDSEVDYSSAWKEDQRVLIPWKKGIKNTSMYADVFEDCDQAGVSLLEGRNPKTADEIAISTHMADNLGKKIGDYIKVSLDGRNNVELLITGTYQTYYEMGEACRLCMDAYTQRDIDVKPDRVAVFLKDGVDRTAYMKKLSGKLGENIEVMKREKCCESIMDMIAAPQKKAIPPVSILILAIGAVNIFSITVLRNQKNLKMNQIYKSIGYSTGELILSNLYYVGVIGLLSIVVGVPFLCLTYEKVMTLSLSIFGLKQYPTDFNWGHLILANIGVLICFLLSTLLSSKSLKKVNVRDLVID